jgi:hypothetical protein
VLQGTREGTEPYLPFLSTTKAAVIDAVTGAAFTASKVIDIPATVGNDTAFVGFTAGTGGATFQGDVLTWAFGS